jgi:hypothetical protein
MVTIHPIEGASGLLLGHYHGEGDCFGAKLPMAGVGNVTAREAFMKANAGARASSAWNKRIRLTALAAALALLIGSVPATAEDHRDNAIVRVMTRSLYTGAQADPVIAATAFPALIGAAGQVYQGILASNPAERAAAVAREIVRHNVDLAGLQEAAILRKGPFQAPPNPATFVPATTVVSDELELILQELARMGERFEVVAIVPGFDAQLPTPFGFDARLTTRIAMPARVRT